MDLSFRYEMASTGKYLVLCLPAGIKVLTYQLNMLKYCSHPQILPVEKRLLNEKTELYYQINGLLPLRDFLKKPLRGGEILNLLESLLRCLENCKKMLLFPHSFLLDINYIFVQPETRDLVLVYLPWHHFSDVNVTLRQFTDSFIKEIVLADNRRDLNTLKCLADYQKTEEFNLAGLQKLVNKLRILDLKDNCLKPPGVVAEKPYRLTAALPDQASAALTMPRKPGKKEILFFVIFQLVIILVFLLLAKTLGELLGAGVFKIMLIITLTAYNVILLNKFWDHYRSWRKTKKTGAAPEKWHDYLVGKLARDKGILLQEFDKNYYQEKNRQMQHND